MAGMKVRPAGDVNARITASIDMPDDIQDLASNYFSATVEGFWDMS